MSQKNQLNLVSSHDIHCSLFIYKSINNNTTERYTKGETFDHNNNFNHIFFSCARVRD